MVVIQVRLHLPVTAETGAAGGQAIESALVRCPAWSKVASDSQQVRVAVVEEPMNDRECDHTLLRRVHEATLAAGAAGDVAKIHEHAHDAGPSLAGFVTQFREP